MISLTYGHASDKVCVSVMVRTPWLLHSILCYLNMSNVDIIIVDSLSSTIKLIIIYVIIGVSPTLVSSMQTPSVCVCMLYILVLVLISRLFHNCMCPSTCGFKLGDHYLLKLLTK